MTDHTNSIDGHITIDGQDSLDGYLPLNIAAERAGVSPSRLRGIAAIGDITARKVAGRWLVHEEAIQPARVLIEQSTRKPGQGARIEQKIDSLEHEVAVLIGTIDTLYERIMQMGNLIADSFTPADADAVYQHILESDGTGQHLPPFDGTIEAEAPPVLSSVAELADQIIADQSSIAAQEQVERADRDLRVNGLH